MKTKILRYSHTLNIEVCDIDYRILDQMSDSTITLAIESLVSRAEKRFWSGTPHKHKARFSESSCELCGNQEDRQPHIH